MKTSSLTVALGLASLAVSASWLLGLEGCSATDASGEATDAGAEAAEVTEAGDAGEGGVRKPATMAVLTSVVARAVGRNGGDLQVTVQGEDPTGTAYAAHIRVRDAAGNRVLAFDGNWNGPAPGVFGDKAAERRVLFDPSDAPGEATFTRTITLRGMLAAFPSIARIDFAVLTAGDKHSIKHFADVKPQPTVALGKTCDPALVADRCAAGSGCIGKPPLCAKPGAPALALFAYVPGPDGPHMLFQGADPAGEVRGARVEFLDAVGGPQLIDLGNATFTSSEEVDFADGWSAGSFFFDNVASPGFEGIAPRLAATPVGVDGGARATATFGAPKLMPAGQACDGRGFVGCAQGAACIRDAATHADVCMARATAKATLRAAAPMIDRSAGQSFATGYARGTSLWDPPSGCLAASARGRPEGLVRLHLDAAVSSLTISTALEETSFDTVVYLLSGGGDTEDSPLACNDDVAGSASGITLHDLDAGDYTIVVDSKSTTGGRFGVKVQ